MFEIAVPGMVEEPHLDPGIGEPSRDEHVILAERVELQLLREADLVIRGAGRVVAARRHAGIEVAVRLEVHRASVLDQALLAQPRLGHDAPALGPSGDEVELVPGPWPCWAFGNTASSARRWASPMSRPIAMRSSAPRTRTSVAPAFDARSFTSTP